MHVDKKRFVSLVAAIAGMTSCAKEAVPTPPLAPLEVAVPPQPAQPVATMSVASASPTESPTPISPASEGMPAPVAEGRASSVIDQYDPAGKHTCGELRCPPGHPFAEGLKVLMHDCRGLERGLKPEPFQRFIQCMLRQNNTRATCDLLLVSTDPGDCLERWHEPQVLDPQTATACSRIVQKCSAKSPPPPNGRKPLRSFPATRKTAPTRQLTMNDCQGILTVTKDPSKPKMVACMNEYCEDAPRLCYMNLSYP